MRAYRTAAVTIAGTVSGGLVVRAVGHRRRARKGYDVPAIPRVTDPAFGRLIEGLTAAPVTYGNTVRVLRNGCRIFPAMLEAIRGAEHTVDFATYVYWTGSIAEEFVEALSERARAGIEVNVLLDAVGAAKMDPQLSRRLQESGATVAWYRPLRMWELDRVNQRTHRKILVVDGCVGFTGGVGIAEEWTGDCEDEHHWRDTHVRVEGPAVRGLYGGFQENWAEATRTILTGAHLPEIPEQPGGVAAQVVRSTAGSGSTDAEEFFYSAISAARERLWITTAYFAPRAAFVDALIDAAVRGVDVRVLTNGGNIDKAVVRQAGRRSYEPLLATGVRIFEYQRTMLHAKVMTVDCTWSTVGSINLDNRSFALNDELNISFHDPGITAELDADFERDLRDAEEIQPRRWRGRPATMRLKELLAGSARQDL